jgi:uncharacterized OB-fold protein
VEVKIDWGKCPKCGSYLVPVQLGKKKLVPYCINCAEKRKGV